MTAFDCLKERAGEWLIKVGPSHPVRAITEADLSVINEACLRYLQAVEDKGDHNFDVADFYPRMALWIVQRRRGETPCALTMDDFASLASCAAPDPRHIKENHLTFAYAPADAPRVDHTMAALEKERAEHLDEEEDIAATRAKVMTHLRTGL